MTGDNVLDVHTHFFPAGMTDLAVTTGDPRWPSLRVDPSGSGRIMRGSEVFRPVAPTCWDLVARATAMDALGIAEQVLSPVPVTLTTWAEPALAAQFARTQNDAFAAAVAVAPPGRFRWIGCVPLQDPDLAVAELERGVRELGMLGVEIGTEVGGRELDDPLLNPFFAAAEDLGVAVFIHPTDGAGAIRRGGVPYEFAIGMLTDTAMAATALVFGGVLDSYPRLRVGLAHGCGSFPWVYPRVARGATMRPGANGVDDTLRHSAELVRRMWVDTLVFDRSHLPLLMERFGADHLMLGSDFPFYPPSFGHPRDVVDSAVACSHCTPSDAAGMLRSNAEQFLSQDDKTA
jgi:aminocarboxymuconate-semialdehyde decarboxylase